MPAATTFTVTLLPNYHTIHAHLTIDTEDAWPASTITVSGRYLWKGRYFPMHPFVRDGQDTDDWYSIVFGLQEGDFVQTQVIFTRVQDSDGEVLESIVTDTSSTTRISPTADNYTDTAYVNPATGNNNNDGTTPALADQTIREGSFDGDRIVIIDGTYDYDDFPAATGGWDNSSNLGSPQSGWDGTAAVYKSIVAQTEGGVTLTGARALSGTWTRAAANLYYHTLVGFRFAEGRANEDLTLAPGLIRRTSDSFILHLYSSVATLTTGTFGEGFCIDWANSRIYISTPTDATPSATDYETAGPANQAMILTNCDYVIIDGLHFDGFAQCDRNAGSVTSSSDNTGAVRLTIAAHRLGVGNTIVVSGHSIGGYNTTHTITAVVSSTVVETDVATAGDGTGGSWTADDSSLHTTRAALQINSCTNIVIRNCTFTCGGISFGAGCDKITIEDCTFSDYDPWARVDADLPTATTAFWAEYKDSARNERQAIISAAGDNSQIVVRRCTFTEHWTALNFVAGSGNDNADIYDNTFSRIFDDAIECDGSGSTAESGFTNGAIWNNTFTNTGCPVSASPFSEGPIWVINNTGVNWRFGYGPIRKGDIVAVGESSGAGPILFYNNTFINTLQHEDGTNSGFHCWSTNRTQSNGRYINNVFSGNGRFYMDCTAGSFTWLENDPDVLMSHNAFYTATTFSDPWVWDQEDYATEALMVAGAPSTQIQVAGNVYGTDPYPDMTLDGDQLTLGDLASVYQGVGASIPGITNIAADEDGYHIVQPCNMGAFAGFVQESVPEEGTRGKLQTNNFTRPN